MADVHTAEQRSRNMAAIKGKNTKPEMDVRRVLHGLGYRYRLHGKGLPGRPDLVFCGRRRVIFVHGCYWHMHDCKFGRVVPKTRTEFWQAKRLGNFRRDAMNASALAQDGWRILVVWECEVKNQSSLARRLAKFLGAER